MPVDLDTTTFQLEFQRNKKSHKKVITSNKKVDLDTTTFQFHRSVRLTKINYLKNVILGSLGEWPSLTLFFKGLPSD